MSVLVISGIVIIVIIGVITFIEAVIEIKRNLAFCKKYNFKKISFKEFINYYNMAPKKWYPLVPLVEKWRECPYDILCLIPRSIRDNDNDFLSNKLFYIAETKDVGYGIMNTTSVELYYFYMTGHDAAYLKRFWKNKEKLKEQKKANERDIKLSKYLQEDINTYRESYLKELEKQQKVIEEQRNRFLNLEKKKFEIQENL